MILLPAIDLYEGKVVRLTRGDYSRMTVYREDPLDQAREFEIAGAAWLHTAVSYTHLTLPTNSRV